MLKKQEREVNVISLFIRIAFRSLLEPDEISLPSFGKVFLRSASSLLFQTVWEPFGIFGGEEINNLGRDNVND